MSGAVYSTTNTAVSWNGPICPTCGVKYLGSHTCSVGDILRRVQELLALLDGDMPLRRPQRNGLDFDQTAAPEATC